MPKPALQAEWLSHLPDVRRWAFMALAALALMATSVDNYLLFHTLVELFSIMVGVLIGVVAWNTYAFSRNHFLTFLGCGYFWVASLDLVHTLIFKGVNIFPQINDGRPEIELWIGARYLEALLLLAAPAFLRRSFPVLPLFILLGLVSSGIFLLILAGLFPVAYIDGQGLTPFKIYSEYLIVMLLFAAILHLAWQRGQIDPDVFTPMVWSITLTMMAEMAFTTYVSVYDMANVIGHIFKLFSFWLIFEAIIHTTLKTPFRVMARGASTYDAVPEPTVLVDLEGRVRKVNKAACDFTGEMTQALLGRDVHELFHDLQTPREACRICQHIRGGLKLEATEFEREPGGSWYRVTLSAVRSPDLAHGMVHLCSDVTRRARAEQALKARQVALERSNRELEQFAHIASHDLQEPLRSVVSFLQLLERRQAGKLDDRSREYIDFAVSGAKRMQEMINNLLEISRIDGEQHAAERLSMERVLESVVDDLDHAIREAHAVVTHDALPSITAHRSQMHRLLKNLLENALRYRADAPPKIHLSAERIEHDAARMSTAATDSGWMFTVQDNGIGIDPEHAETVFLMFRRLDGRSTAGSGIGLSLCRRIIERHGGKIWVEPAEPHGTQVRFTVPDPSGNDAGNTQHGTSGQASQGESTPRQIVI